MAQLADTALASDANLVAYYKLEDANDTTANAFNLTNNNTVTFVAAKFNNGADLGTANTNKYLSTTNTLGIDGGNISISLWVKLRTEIASGTYSLVFQGNATSDITYIVEYEYNGGTRRLRWGRLKGGADTPIYTNTTLGTTDWHHIVITYDGTTQKVYRNGSLIDSGATSGNGLSNVTEGFTIGADPFFGNYASAYIDDVGVFSRALTAGEIATLYADGTNTNSLDLELGSSQFAYVADTAALSLTGNLSIAAWVKFESDTGDETTIAAKWQNNNNKRGYLFMYNASGNTLQFYDSDNGANISGVSSDSWTPTLDTWYHVVVTKSGTTIAFYIDSVASGGGTISYGTIVDNDARFSLGAYSTDAGGQAFMDGSLDEVVVTSDVMSSTEIADLFAGWDATEKLDNIAGYWKLNNDYTDSSGNGQTLTSSGSPVFSFNVPFANYAEETPSTGLGWGYSNTGWW